MPFLATKIKSDLILEQRDDLWAEALWQYRQGMPLFLDHQTEALAVVEQSQRMDNNDEWIEMIEKFINNKETVITSEITLELLDIPLGQVSPIQSRRIAGIMRRLGWESCQFWKNNTSTRGYRRRRPTAPR